MAMEMPDDNDTGGIDPDDREPIVTRHRFTGDKT